MKRAVAWTVGYEELLFTAGCENLVRKEICYEPYWFIYFPPGAALAAPFCWGDEENARIYAVHLTTANQSKMCRAHLVSVEIFTRRDSKWA